MSIKPELDDSWCGHGGEPEPDVTMGLLDAAIDHIFALQREGVRNDGDDYERARNIESIAHGWLLIKRTARAQAGREPE